MKEYKFYGVDFKTELKLGGICGVLILCLLTFIEIIFHQITPRVSLYQRMINIFISLAITLLLIRFLGKKLRKIWILQLKDKKILIEYNKKKKEINLDQIKKIIINGGSELRYFTIITSIEKIKIRLGTGALAPFSKKKDLEEIDCFTKQLQPYLNQNFIKNDRRVKLSPPGTIKLTYTRKT
ncbi:hypothetical protein ETU10_01160 [Apibacter muscae]|uniref:hypothetical protein n=1 Tax=Apibacter muscae TaxID=2509004 RepID=UPI0011AC7A35|nr:hypothetical protein [Apibacter muscae]TWP25272.1 hypothetical protein ETU10_01160 [Apibacter muscae]